RPRPRTRTQRTCPPCTRTLRTRTQRTCTPCTRTLRTRTQRTCTPCTRTLRTCTHAAARARSRLPLHARRAPTPQLTHRTSEGELNEHTHPWRGHPGYVRKPRTAARGRDPKARTPVVGLGRGQAAG